MREERAEAPAPDGCRESCDAAGEPLAGSAGRVAAWIGIRWPKPLWHPSDPSRSEGLPGGVAERLDAHAARGPKLALRLYQRDARPSTDAVELVLWRPQGPSGVLRGVPPRELGERIADYLGGHPLPLQPLGTQLFVCTDGRHDACCARHGAPLYRALRLARDELPGGTGPELAECSHLGGHRFAANCLALPAGDLYGRVGVLEVPALLTSLCAGRPYLERLRGNLAGEPVLTAAAAFLSRQDPALQWRLASAQPEGDAPRVRAWIRTAQGEAQVNVCGEVRSFRTLASCGEEWTQSTRWVPTHLEPAGSRDGDARAD